MNSYVVNLQTESHQETYQKIVKVDLKFPSHVSSGAKDLIKKLLQKNPKNRLPLEEVMKHNWISEMMNQSKETNC